MNVNVRTNGGHQVQSCPNVIQPLKRYLHNDCFQCGGERLTSAFRSYQISHDSVRSCVSHLPLIIVQNFCLNYTHLYARIRLDDEDFKLYTFRLLSDIYYLWARVVCCWFH